MVRYSLCGLLSRFHMYLGFATSGRWFNTQVAVKHEFCRKPYEKTLIISTLRKMFFLSFGLVRTGFMDTFRRRVVLSFCGIWNMQVPWVYGHHILFACHPNPPCPGSVCEAAGCRWLASLRLRTHTHHSLAGASLSAAPLAILFPRSSAPIAHNSHYTTFINLHDQRSFQSSHL